RPSRTSAGSATRLAPSPGSATSSPSTLSAPATPASTPSRCSNHTSSRSTWPWCGASTAPSTSSAWSGAWSSTPTTSRSGSWPRASRPPARRAPSASSAVTSPRDSSSASPRNADRRLRPGGSDPAAGGEVVVVDGRGPVAAPDPPGGLEGLDHRAGTHDHAGSDVAAIEVGGGGRWLDASVDQVRVLDRVEIDGGADGVERQVGGPGDRAEVEGRGVVGGHGAGVVAAEALDPLDPLEREPDR